MKEKHLDAFMDTAYRFAELSTAVRAQVGAIIVKDRRIISIGYNGMPSGWDNCCEDTLLDGSLKTKPQVLHAEANAIAKLAQSPESARDSTLFCTHMPCIECAKLIHQSGIRTVFYGERYEAAKGSGEEFLSKSGIKLEWLPPKPKNNTAVEKIVEVERVINAGKPVLFDKGKLMPPNNFYTIIETQDLGTNVLTVDVYEKIAFFHIGAKYNWDMLHSDILAVDKLFDITDWVIDYSYEAHLLQADDQNKGLIFDIIHSTVAKLNLSNARWHLLHGNYYIKDTYKRSININVPYEKMPAQFTELNKNLVSFTIKLILFGINNNADCYNLINEYKRLINSSARGSKIDVNFNRLQLNEQRKIIDIYMLCNKIINTNTDMV